MHGLKTGEQSKMHLWSNYAHNMVVIVSTEKFQLWSSFLDIDLNANNQSNKVTSNSKHACTWTCKWSKCCYADTQGWKIMISPTNHKIKLQHTPTSYFSRLNALGCTCCFFLFTSPRLLLLLPFIIQTLSISKY